MQLEEENRTLFEQIEVYESVLREQEQEILSGGNHMHLNQNKQQHANTHAVTSRNIGARPGKGQISDGNKISQPFTRGNKTGRSPLQERQVFDSRHRRK